MVGGRNKYELKNGDIVYSTPASLAIMQDASLESDKLVTIQKGTEVEVLEVLDTGWSYVRASFRNGYTLSEALSNINPLRQDQEGENGSELSREELLASLSYDMDVGVPSGLSLDQFREILQGRSQDKNGIFEENCDYFYYAEQEYGINGVFLASIAILESGWGTSKIALDKNNLFGYQAYDDSAYASAKEFESYSEGIDLVARVLIKYYLNPSGTGIYGGDVADGRYYSGETISAVNRHYASNSSWASSVYSIMKMLYNEL